jgi:hypothetical protein
MVHRRKPAKAVRPAPLVQRAEVIRDKAVKAGVPKKGTTVPKLSTLPEDAAARYRFPLAEGLLYYFPSALALVAEVSRIGNEQHNPGEPMHWARGKSIEHADKIMRHLMDAGGKDSQGVRHTARLAWRALALLQEECERDEGAPLPRNARLPD